MLLSQNVCHQTRDEMKTEDDNELTMCTEIMHPFGAPNSVIIFRFGGERNDVTDITFQPIKL